MRNSLYLLPYGLSSSTWCQVECQKLPNTSIAAICFYTTHIHLKEFQIHKYKHKYIHCCCCCTTHIKLKDLELHKYKHKYTHYSCYIKRILYFPFLIFPFKRLFKFCRHLYMVVNISQTPNNILPYLETLISRIKVINICLSRHLQQILFTSPTRSSKGTKK